MIATVLKTSSILLSGIAILVSCSGCAAFQGHGLNPLYHGQLSDGRKIELSEYWEMDAIRNNPQFNYVALIVGVTTPEQPPVEYEVARQGGTQKTVQSIHFQFGQLEARTDASGQRLWFVDKSAGGVIASLDLLTVAATGPQDWPPPWADPKGGRLVAPAPS